MSGQKISSFGTEEETENLLSYAWKNWNEGTYSNHSYMCGIVTMLDEKEIIDPILLKSVIKEYSVRNYDTLSWNLSYQDGSMTGNAATAYPKPPISFQRVAREGKEVELFRQVVILGTRLIISTSTLQRMHQCQHNLHQNLSGQHHKKD
ncbi:hypothetical protein LWI28_004075 [Acer negundo]|uniref:Uncharacterized protein n=1 Tax=Acer negundo TaxID=4023 RepID=A0AAD5P3S0_ACENE|nr:hypothetical protein LWI28_004075 [Acer negundo]